MTRPALFFRDFRRHFARAAALRMPASCLLALAVAACATHVPPPAAAAIAKAPPAAVVAVPRTAGGTLPLVPQPAERPVAPPSVTDPAIPLAQRIDNFVDYTATTYGVAPQRIRAMLAQAVFKQPIIDAISRPAEGVKPWSAYRPIFVNDTRIDGGIAFYSDNRAALDAVAASTGVPAQYIVAIIGVETGYGKNAGNYRVLDALYTLAFGYPKRAPFFAGELAQLFALADEEPGLDLATLKGSYAGAMGMGQFMPSSYRLWAKDGDGDGRRELLTHKPDVFASIANYFAVHGWQPGGPLVARAARAPGTADFVPPTLDPVYTLPDLAARGYTAQPGQRAVDGATLLSLDGDAGREYWLGFRNFYVITRYNRSPMYALSVVQLAQAIAEGSGAPAP